MVWQTKFTRISQMTNGTGNQGVEYLRTTNSYLTQGSDLIPGPPVLGQLQPLVLAS